MTIPNGKTLILGIGNILMGDEGVGVNVLRSLLEHPLPAHVECLDGGTGGLILLEPLQMAARIIMIDAAADGNPIGTVSRTQPRFSHEYPRSLTAHDIGVKELLDLYEMLGGSAPVTLYAITIDPKQPIRVGLSPQIEASAAQALQLILDELASGSI